MIALILEFFCLNYLKREENKRELSTWLGGYCYCGQLEDGKRCYTIDIYEIDRKYYAELVRRNGLEPDTRTLGYVKGGGKSINIYFEDTLPGDSLYEDDRYKKNELLMILSHTDTELQTSWYTFRQEHPVLCGEEEGITGVVFEKEE